VIYGQNDSVFKSFAPSANEANRQSFLGYEPFPSSAVRLVRAARFGQHSAFSMAASVSLWEDVCGALPSRWNGVGQ